MTATLREPGGNVALPPGIDLPPIVQTLAWGIAPTWLLDRCARRLGDTFTQTFGPSGFKLVHFSDPQAVKTLLMAPEEIAPKPVGGAGAPVWVLGRNSLSVLVGAEHMRQRKLLLPSFHGERLQEHERVIVKATRSAMATWRLGRPITMQHHVRAITLEVIMETVFGLKAERTEGLRATIVELMDLNYLIVRLRALVGGGLGDERPRDKIGRTLDRLDVQIYGEIKHRREQSDTEHRSDVMSMLLVARDEDGERLTDVEVRDELVTLLLAGHETTATTVAWAIELLVRHPDKLARLIAEIDAQSETGGDQYLTAVIYETLRVRPVQPSVARMLTQDFQVGRFLLPAGTWAVASIYLTNRNPHVYDDPTAFRPERFLHDVPETYCGYRSAEAFAAALAPRSRRWRRRSSWERCSLSSNHGRPTAGERVVAKGCGGRTARSRRRGALRSCGGAGGPADATTAPCRKPVRSTLARCRSLDRGMVGGDRRQLLSNWLSVYGASRGGRREEFTVVEYSR